MVVSIPLSSDDASRRPNQQSSQAGQFSSATRASQGFCGDASRKRTATARCQHSFPVTKHQFVYFVCTGHTRGHFHAQMGGNTGSD